VKLVKKVKVKNDLGLHIRPATAIVKMLQNKKSSVFFTYKRDTVNARSIMNLLMLLAKKNAVITITVDGKDALITMDELTMAFDKNFGEKKHANNG
jgi:phosphocarrier protein HPr